MASNMRYFCLQFVLFYPATLACAWPFYSEDLNSGLEILFVTLPAVSACGYSPGSTAIRAWAKPSS